MHDIFLPAEWAPQCCIQLTWPHADTDWAPYLDEITQTFVEIADAVTRRERLIVASQVPDETWRALSVLTEEQRQQVTVVECPTDDTWARDHGALTLSDGTLIDFRFNGWGRKFPAENDNRITRHLIKAGALQGRVVAADDFVLEGGSIESDGEGTVFTTSQCLLAPNRNQPLTKKAIELLLKRSLHAQRLIWLNHGNLIGDDTDGHIDTIVRVGPDNTLLYIKADNPDDPQYDDFKMLENELRALATVDGAPYRLLPLPMTRPVVYDGERLPATYANFLVLNGAVIVPTYQQPDLDEEACRTIGLAFPGREIIPIDATVIVRQHGSIHCLTMQYPCVAPEREDGKE